MLISASLLDDAKTRSRSVRGEASSTILVVLAVAECHYHSMTNRCVRFLFTKYRDLTVGHKNFAKTAYANKRGAMARWAKCRLHSLELVALARAEEKRFSQLSAERMSVSATDRVRRTGAAPGYNLQFRN